MSRTWSRVAGPVLALVLLAGCTASPPTDEAAAEGTSAEQTTTPTTGTTTSPATETSGGGTRTQVNQPTVSVPVLPVGGVGQGSAHEQCVSVNYLGDEPVPAGARVTVTGVSLTPALLEVGGSACSPEEIPCLGPDFAFAPGDDPGTCFVPVRGTGPPVDDEDENAVDERVDLGVEALAVCPRGEQQTCDDFAAAAAGDAQTIQLDIRVADTTETTEATTEETTPTTEATTEEAPPSDDAGTPTD